MKKTSKLSYCLSTLLVALLFCAGALFPSVPIAKAQGVDPHPLVLFDFEDGAISGWGTGNVSRGERQGVELARAEEGDSVRFGNRALRLNFDFTNAQTAQTLCSFFTPPSFTIPASDRPRKLGMWVYATPEAQGIWMRFQLTNLNNGGLLREFAGEPTIDWVGWRYVEINLPRNVPIGPRQQFIRLLSINSGNPGPMTNGYLVVDHIRVSHAEEDRVAPTISAVTGGEITGREKNLHGQTFTTGKLNIVAKFDDTGVSSGINYEDIRVIVDGHTFKTGDADFFIDKVANTVTLNGLSLTNGLHTVEVHVEDNFGNISTETASFTVDAGEGTTVSIVPAHAEVPIGSVYELQLNTNNSRDVKEVNFTLRLNNITTVDAMNGVVFAPSVREHAFSFSPRRGLLTVTLKNDTAAPPVKTLATIHVNIAKIANHQDVFRCSPVSAKVTFADHTFSTFTFSPIETKLSAHYTVAPVKRIVGAPGEVLVTDLDGTPQSGVMVNVLDADGAKLESAVTGANGIAAGLTNFTKTVQNVSLYAEKEGKYSYTRLVKSLKPNLTATPTYIRAGATVDPTRSKRITWMSNPLTTTGSALMKVAKKNDGEGRFVQYEGKTRMNEYDGTGSDWAVLASAVTLDNLEAGTTYIYQVGDGTTWSPTRELTTTTLTDQFSFSAFGDLQASSTQHMTRFLAAAETIEAMPQKPLFHLNVADIVDTDDRYDYYAYYGLLLNARPVFANIDMVAAYGNHEYMGTLNADNIKFACGTPILAPSDKYNTRLVGNGSYAVEYGNMLVMALDWAGRPGHTEREYMREQAKWMDEVLSQNNKLWKIVSVHYPIFPAASAAGAQEIFGPLFDKYNVQLVFCGHGHTFERVQVRHGKVISPTDNRRTFEPVIGGTLHFQIGGMKETNRNGRWVHCAVDGRKMTVTVRDANNEIVPEEGFILYATP